MPWIPSVLSSCCWLLTVVAAEPETTPTSVPTPTAPSAPRSTGFAEHMAEAEALRAEWRYDESARSFAEAYYALDEIEQAGLTGEIAVGNAVDDFGLALDKAPDDEGLLTDEVILLELHRERMGELPAELQAELERAQGRLRAIHEQAAIAHAAREREAAEREQQRQALEHREQLAQRRREAERERQALEHEQRQQRTRRDLRRQTAVIEGVGVASTGIGIAMVANGVWNRNNVAERAPHLRTLVNASTAAPPQDRAAYRAEVDRWEERWKRIGTGMIVSGALLTAAGVSVTFWGLARWGQRRVRPPSAAIVPGVGRGLTATMKWRF